MCARCCCFAPTRDSFLRAVITHGTLAPAEGLGDSFILETAKFVSRVFCHGAPRTPPVETLMTTLRAANGTVMTRLKRLRHFPPRRLGEDGGGEM